ncbi:pyridoxal phosphate-dependent aminotransferase family protein [Solirubrobacter ginsenosidimutans]|uniref:8-amino-7-oxononanoate synthase n=1 Tax=Solirubrobacter ginsenosidimutans TaxID=490573 RepID=A0A9X3MUF4_9ACTN|nr:pyridoxal phosphate-dependent aminotransferase family protein [Solirubrobacter ginsenosidimutans]MDA0162715.1 pyridoxal phosphate-dependent aminotransferase family protein [Solirubrobacter ginsenosidimutans]
MLDLEDRLDELNQLGLHQRMRMVSGPQGPRVVLDGRPVLLLCSGNALGLADHPKVRQAAADAAMRWGVGAGAARVSSGTMTLHRRLEERLATFTHHRAALLFGSGAMANMGVIPALARRAEVVLHDELSHTSIADGCRLSGAEVVAYRHADPEHLAWALRQSDGRATLIATDGMFGMDGDVAPLAEIVELARVYDARVLVDEAHALGALGPGGRGAVAEAGLEGQVDVVTGTLGKALGSYGGFVACDHVTARFLVHSARTLLHSTALPPVAAAAAMAALDLLEEQPRRVEKLRANAEALRDGLAREGFEVAGAAAHVVPLVVGDAELASRIVDHALELGVFAEAIRPPAVPEGTARVRLSAMASHTREELRGAATAMGRAALRAGFRPGAGLPVAAAQGAVFDGQSGLARAA